MFRGRRWDIFRDRFDYAVEFDEPHAKGLARCRIRVVPRDASPEFWVAMGISDHPLRSCLLAMESLEALATHLLRHSETEPWDEAA